ncbi:MAG TPA: hypothetical protein VFL93_04315 [Longimicrobiaceae bacterium]|nr:hypothetical protein [Longimicrobiaceae bacterium]
MSFVVAWAGFIAIISSAVLFWLLRALRLTTFSPSEQLGGIFLTDPRHPGADSLGFFVLLVLGTLVFPEIYRWLLSAGPGVTAAWGALLGTVHGFVAAAALPLLGTISASVRAGRTRRPGPFGRTWGRMTPVVVVAGHAVYGAVLGATLANS